MGSHNRVRSRARLSAAAALTAAAAATTALTMAPAAEAATPATGTSSSTLSSAMASDLAALRGCESSGNYATNTGNGFYGAYQFDQGTWQSLGYSGLPSSAAPAVQDQAAAQLESERGWEPWPSCSAQLGLTPISGVTLVPAATSAAAVVTAPVTAAAVAPVAPVQAAPVQAVHIPAFPGIVLTTAMVNQRQAAVAVWQARMVVRGWHLAVDGYFGPQSAGVARAFALQKGIHTPFPGQVDAAVWKASWTAPITLP